MREDVGSALSALPCTLLVAVKGLRTGCNSGTDCLSCIHVSQGALGDSTAALSKELQQATPRRRPLDAEFSDFPTCCLLPGDRLDSLMDSLAELSTSSAPLDSGNDGSDGSYRGGCRNGGGGAANGFSSAAFSFSAGHRGSSDCQVVPERGAEDCGSPGYGRSSDSGDDWCTPAARQHSMESCGGSAALKQM